jgi:hypothetical protein
MVVHNSVKSEYYKNPISLKVYNMVITQFKGVTQCVPHIFRHILFDCHILVGELDEALDLSLSSVPALL